MQIRPAGGAVSVSSPEFSASLHAKFNSILYIKHLQHFLGTGSSLQVPYNDMTPLQAAVGVVQKGLRPGIPTNCPPALATVMVACWDTSPAARPSFRELAPRLQQLCEAVRDDEARKIALATAAASKPSGGLLAKFRGKG